MSVSVKKSPHQSRHLLQEGGPLPGPETGLLSNTQKWIVRGDTYADKARDFTGKGHLGGEQYGSPILKIPNILLEILITLIDFNSPCIWESSVDWVFLGLEFLLLYDIKGHCTCNKPETSICEKVLEKYTNIWKEKV